ncbi:Uncharacterised protein [Mycobacteroides abscessus subsp. abscessus]|nr:Uncharacterised protein [Mycobacteroides abscessus subsp. abscessus]
MGYITVIPVMYRDAANWKVHGVLRLDGAITPEQVTALRLCLSEGLYFVPHMLGFEHFGDGEWRSFPCEDDHDWHEMYLDEFKVVDLTQGGSSLPTAEKLMHGGSVATFLDTFIAVSACGWAAQDPLADQS